MEVLASRILVRVADHDACVAWYRDVLGLRVSREYGRDGRVTGTVLFLGGGFLEVVGSSDPAARRPVTLWLQVPDVDAEHERLAAAGAQVARPPRTEPWGLRECWVDAPEGTEVVLVEVPEAHPMRRRLDVD
jgi:predicted enzyme related to lactoylglutathione lyase